MKTQLRYDKTSPAHRKLSKTKISGNSIKHVYRGILGETKKQVVITLLISVLLLSPFFLSLSAATTTIGQTTVGNNSAWQSGGVMVGSRFTASGGTPVSMSVYIAQSGSSSNTAKCAIYSESNKQLIAVTEQKTIPAGFNGWLTFNFGSSSSLTSGSSYSLVVWFKNSASTVRYSSGSAAQTWYAIQSYTGSFPNGPYSSLGSYGQENNVYSIYCTLNADVTSSPSPSTSPSPSSVTNTTNFVIYVWSNSPGQ